MHVNLSKYAELFYIAHEDLWCAEQTFKGSPNNAVWSCCQAVEKTLKGLLEIYDLNDDPTHDLGVLLETVEVKHNLSTIAVNNINYLASHSQRLRYKKVKTDPTSDDAAEVIKRTKQIMQEFSDINKCALAFQEAKDEHVKMLKREYENT